MARLYPLFLALTVAKHVLPISTLARLSWRRSRTTSRDRVAEQRLVSAVLRLGGWAGHPERDCLQRSLLLYRELSYVGADPRLIVGFRRGDRRLEGHAWVETDDTPIAETSARDHGFETLWSFGRDGAIHVPDRITG
jgi:hypothetical protein